MFKKLLKYGLKYGLEYALKRYGSRMQGKPYGGYTNAYGVPSKRYYKKRKKKKLFDLFD
jgi:hypothetical protein